MKKRRNIHFCGFILLLLWVSYVPYLFPAPFGEYSGIESVSRESSEFIKDEALIDDYSQEDIERKMALELQINWFLSLLIILSGIISSILIIRTVNLGRLIAIGLSFFLLIKRIFYLISSDYFWELISVKYFLMHFNKSPAKTIHDKIQIIILLITNIYLLRPSVAKGFKKSLP